MQRRKQPISKWQSRKSDDFSEKTCAGFFTESEKASLTSRELSCLTSRDVNVSATYMI